MGKRLIIIGFLTAMVCAVYLFWTRETASIRDNLRQKALKEPRVVLEDFVLYRYTASEMRSKLTARLGHFFEPNIVELYGEIKASRYGGKRESIGAEAATGYFTEISLVSNKKPNELEKAELTGFVEVGMEDHVLTTDYAEYLKGTDQVRSSRPVRVEGPNRVFTGENGFRYLLSTQSIEMPGTIKGVLKPDEP